MNENLRTHWIYSKSTRRFVVSCALLSFVSVCANTPETIQAYPVFNSITIFADIFAGIVLSVEMLFKIYLKGMIKGDKPYFKDVSCVFDCVDTIFIWISVMVQAVELSQHEHEHEYEDPEIAPILPLGLSRVPRALVIIRAFRYFLSSGSGQVTAIVLRASQHIAGVTLFLVFFILLYGILGVQMFGDFSYHCVTKDTDPRNVTLQNLAIPDTTCSKNDSSLCPENMTCMHIHLSMKQTGYGSFDNIAISIKTVYEAASQEGWIFLMYKSIDSYEDWLGYFYFIFLIFFLAWLVKNVFIAVIIDAFAEIRVQLHSLWGNAGVNRSTSATQVLSTEGESWRLIATEDVSIRTGIFEAWRLALHSRYFHIMMQVAIILNVSIIAFQPRLEGESKWNFFSVAELIFTIVFDVEALMKICCMGIVGYIMTSTCRYEAFLALGTTVNTIFNFPFLNSFPVLRIIRLVKLSPTLEGFVYKILGPAKKIGALVIITFSFVILMSCFSLQMFCHKESEHFGTFPQAFMSMFQILTQEGWVDVMQATMFSVSPEVRALVAIYFIFYHFFTTTVVVSLFVAVILDNLELDENVKRFKQLKINEQSVDTKQKLPWRLRVFGRFPNRPQMVSVSSHLPGEFQLPRVRESYMRQFLEINHASVTTTSTAVINKSQTERNLSLASKITRSPYLGAAILSGLRVQLTGGAVSPRNIKRTELTKNTIRRRSRCRMQQQNRSYIATGLEKMCISEKSEMSILSGSATKPNMYSNIMEKCIEHRRFNCIVDGKLYGNSSQTLLKPQYALRQDRPSFRTGRVMFAEEARQPDIENIPTFQKHSLQDVDFKVLHLKRQEALLKRERQERELRENHPLFDTPLFLVARESQIRRLCHTLVYAQFKSDMKSNKAKKHFFQTMLNLVGLVTYLDWIMILVTIGSCGFMMLETPTHRVNQGGMLLYAEYAFVICMSIELLLKLTAGGLFFTPKPILKDFGGILDCFIYIVSLTFLCTLSNSIPAQSGGQMLLVLRCLRPLRIFRLVPQIRNVVIELFRGFKDIIMVAILQVALMFVFASFGVEMYGNQLAACNDRTKSNKEDCKGIFFQAVWISNSLNLDSDDPPGFMVPRVWTNPRNFNFDTIGSAMLTLFEVLSLKGWIEVRDILTERFGMAHALYIHIFVFLGSMVGLTLFIGVVIANYNENKGTALLTVDQKRWENLKCRLKLAQPLHLPPRPTGDGFRAKAYDLTQHKYFKYFITICIFLQSMLLCMKWVTSTKDIHVQYLAISCVIFHCIYTIEILIKWIGMTFMGMMTSWRNRYDFLITVGGIIWSFAYCLLSDKTVAYKSGACLIVLRFLSICGKHAILKMLLMTVAVSVYKSFFIIGAMFLLMLCYAFAGVVLFGTVKYGENIDRHANFGSASLAIAVLFRIVTGEDWNKIMHDCMIQPPRCTEANNYWETDCGNISAALMYFCSFYVIIAYIMLNVLVAIIMENFSLFYTMDEEILLSYNYLHMFQVTWNLIDIKRKEVIAVKHVKLLLGLLEGRLRIDPEKDRLLLKHMSYEMYLVGRRHSSKHLENNGYMTKHDENNVFVSFHDVLTMLAYRSIDIRKSLQLEELLIREKREAEIEEAVAKMTICNFIYKCMKKIRLQKSLHTNHWNNVNDIQNEQVFIQSTPDEYHPTEEQDDDVNEGCEFNFPKTGKNRRKGMWRGPSNYMSGAVLATSSLLKPSIIENDARPNENINQIRSWWCSSIETEH
uniref:sodium leak channel non-selective protein-like isoform X1 n=1 Tax=Styela clava TaxID=7725 RepID=UPI00193A0C65|nr:sodium leak channel non-selective protein-like isoform X1 [Styela clava]